MYSLDIKSLMSHHLSLTFHFMQVSHNAVIVKYATLPNFNMAPSNPQIFSQQIHGLQQFTSDSSLNINEHISSWRRFVMHKGKIGICCLLNFLSREQQLRLICFDLEAVRLYMFNCNESSTLSKVGSVV